LDFTSIRFLPYQQLRVLETAGIHDRRPSILNNSKAMFAYSSQAFSTSYFSPRRFHLPDGLDGQKVFLSPFDGKVEDVLVHRRVRRYFSLKH